MASKEIAKVSFYYLRRDDRNRKFQVACQLAAQSFRMGRSVFIWTTHDEDAKTIDQLLWDFPKDSFIPHIVSIEQTEPPHLVRIGSGLPSDRQYLVINLTDETVAFQGLIERVFEIATPLERDRALARYRHYETLECVMEVHKL